MSLRHHRRWGEFYAEERLAPMLERAAGGLGASARAAIEEVMARCRAGDLTMTTGRPGCTAICGAAT